MKYYKNIYQKFGFTIMEAMIAIMVVSFTTLAILLAIPYCQKLVLKTDKKIVSLYLGSETMEKHYNNIDIDVTGAPVSDTIPSNICIGTRTYEVSDNGSYRTITVKVDIP